MPASAPAFDCFYASPTVDVSGGGNTTDFLHIDLVLDVLRAQAGRFSRICRVFAPLYRQRSFNSMNQLTGDAELAYRDVETAFLHFLEHDSQGRNFVLIGQTVDDERPVPPYRYQLQELIGIGLHTGNFSVVMHDLIDSVELQASAMPVASRRLD